MTHIAVPGHEDNRQMNIMVLERRLQVEPGRAGHVKIEKNAAVIVRRAMEQETPRRTHSVGSKAV